MSWFHGCEVESGGLVSFSYHVDLVCCLVDGFNPVIVKDDTVVGVTELADGDKRSVREALVAMSSSGVVGQGVFEVCPAARLHDVACGGSDVVDLVGCLAVVNRCIVS